MISWPIKLYNVSVLREAHRLKVLVVNLKMNNWVEVPDAVNVT